MGVENVGMLFSEFVFSTRFDRLQFTTRNAQSRSETLQLAIYLLCLNARPIDVGRVAMHAQHTANHDAFRNSQPLPALLLARRRIWRWFEDHLRFTETIAEESVECIEGSSFVRAYGNRPQ